MMLVRIQDVAMTSKVPVQHLPGGTAENHELPKSEVPVIWPVLNTNLLTTTWKPFFFWVLNKRDKLPFAT